MPHDKWGAAPVKDDAAAYHPFPTPFDRALTSLLLLPPLTPPSERAELDTDGGWTDEAPDYFSAPYSLQEIDMLALSYALRQKPDWARKLADPAVRARWRAEALETTNEHVQFASREGDDNGAGGYETVEVERPRLTEGMVDYVLDELALHAKALDDPRGIRVRAFRSLDSTAAAR